MAKHESAVERVDRKLRSRGLTLAGVCGVDRSTPAHWDRDASKKNGRGGSIPDKYHVKIIEASKKVKAGVTTADLLNA